MSTILSLLAVGLNQTFMPYYLQLAGLHHSRPPPICIGLNFLVGNPFVTDAAGYLFHQDAPGKLEHISGWC